MGVRPPRWLRDGRTPSSLAQRELLRRTAVAVVDLQPGTVSGGAARRVQAPAGLRIQQRSVTLLDPVLPADAVAVPQLHLRPVRRPVAVDVQAAAEGAQRTVG